MQATILTVLIILTLSSVVTAASLVILVRSLVRKRESLDPNEWYTAEEIASGIAENAKQGLGLGNLGTLLNRSLGKEQKPAPQRRTADR